MKRETRMINKKLDPREDGPCANFFGIKVRPFIFHLIDDYRGGLVLRNGATRIPF